MASFSVQYIFSLVDKFTPGADKMGAAGKKIAAAVDAAGKAVSALGNGASRAVGVFTSIASGALSAASAVMKYVRAMTSAGSAKPPNGGGWGAAARIAERRAAEEKAAARSAMWANARRPVDNMLNRPMNLWASWQMGKAAAHGTDSFIKQFAEPDTIRRKMAFTLGGDAHAEDLAARALQSAKDMSAKYKNTTVTENMHIIDDLRANLPESMEKILDHSVEPFIKLHAFFKAWEGGKHHGKVGDSLKDISLAIRSGELLGNMTGEEIAKHAHKLTVAKAVFGEKFKMSEYFASQKAASMALPGMSDDFKYVGFPLLVQELGTRAGVGLATQFSKMVGGQKITQGQAEYWRSLGLVDQSLINSGQIQLDKAGRIVPKSLLGKKWQVNQRTDDPFVDMVERVLPALEKTGRVKGLDAASLRKAWDAGDPEGVAEAMKKIDKLDLSRELNALYGDRTAITEAFSQVFRLASLARDYISARNVEKSFTNADPTKPIDGYEVAKERLGGSVNRLSNAMFGQDAIDTIISGLDGISGAFERMSAMLKRNGGIVGALDEASQHLARKVVGDGPIDAARKLFGMAGVPLDQQMAEVARRQSSGQWGPSSYFAPAQPYEPKWTVPSNPFGSWTNNVPKNWDDVRIPDSAFSNANVNATPSSSIPQSMSFRLEPLQVQMPESVRVMITGTVNGPVSGEGSIPMSSNAPRGVSTPEAGGGSTAMPY